VLGRKLGAEVHLVCYGGRGLIRDWQGRVSVANAPQFFERALPDDPNSPWDHSCWVPDVVTVMLGTNDFHPGIPEERTYVDALLGFVRRLRETAASAPVVLCESPLFGAREDNGDRAKREALRHYLRQAVQACAPL
jgi:lysophospholipase L1-like esterase